MCARVGKGWGMIKNNIKDEMHQWLVLDMSIAMTSDCWELEEVGLWNWESDTSIS